jgi:hypothetical protein
VAGPRFPTNNEKVRLRAALQVIVAVLNGNLMWTDVDGFRGVTNFPPGPTTPKHERRYTNPFTRSWKGAAHKRGYDVHYWPIVAILWCCPK